MRFGRLFLAAALVTSLLLGLAGSARATTMEPEDVSCPVCVKTFIAMRIRSTNSFGGQDADLCVHAAGHQPLSVWVWTCPHCRYSSPLQDFVKGVKPETAEAIRKGLEPRAPIAANADQLRIPAWVKYDLAVRVRTLDGTPPADLATLQLRGAWATRVESHDLAWPHVGEEPLAAGWNAASERFRALFEDGPEEMPDDADRAEADVRAATALLAECSASRAKGEDAAAAELFAAWKLRERGENVPAQAALAALAARDGIPAAVRSVASALLDSIAREREFQTGFLAARAAAAAAASTAGATPPGNAEDEAVDRFLEAETHRRLGHEKEARASYLAAMEGELRAWIFVKARTALERLGGGPSRERIDALWKARLDHAFARLGDPKAARDAGREMALLRDPSIVRRAVEALASEAEEVRTAAALVIAEQPGPREEAVTPLTKQMLEDTEEACRWRAAQALHATGSLRTREAFVEALEYSDQVRRVAIEALGLVGEADTVPELVQKRGRDARIVDQALSCLTCRPQATPAEFASWWKEHSSESRADWVRAGFREASFEVPAAWSMEHVPALISRLEDGRPYIRVNALRLLRELTGQCFGWTVLADMFDTPRAQMERRLVVREWRRWWKAHNEKR